ncbi:MAG: glycosyltransferase family 39 protein [Candidatus Omnitrophica bacterium]|nr:glycosyltransferase family 39 protein [Candidatus Omnitrophota bacterium]
MMTKLSSLFANVGFPKNVSQKQINGFVYFLLAVILVISAYQSFRFTSALDNSGLIADMKGYYTTALDFKKIDYGIGGGYSVFLAIALMIGPKSPYTAYYAQVLLHLVSIVFIFFIGKRLSGNIAGLIAAALFAFSLEATILQGYLHRDLLRNTLYLGMICFFASRFDDGKKSVLYKILIGILFIFALEAKMTTILTILPFLIVFLFRGWNYLKGLVKKYWISLLTFFVVMMGFGGLNWYYHGSFTVFELYASPLNIYDGNSPVATGISCTESENFLGKIIEKSPFKGDQKKVDEFTMKLVWEFRKNLPQYVRHLNMVRAINWWTTDMDQCGVYTVINAGPALRGKMLISTFWLFILGIPASFLFMVLSAISSINKTKYNYQNHFLMGGLFYGHIAALIILAFSFYIFGDTFGKMFLYSMLAITGIYTFILALCLAKEADNALLTRWLMVSGLALDASIYILFIVVKMRYRIHMIPFYCLCIGGVIGEIVYLIRNKIKSLKKENPS